MRDRLATSAVTSETAFGGLAFPSTLLSKLDLSFSRRLLPYLLAKAWVAEVGRTMVVLLSAD